MILFAFYRYLLLSNSHKINISHKIKYIIFLISIVLIPCLLQIFFLRKHSAIHEFSALKFVIPLAAVPFILIPVLIATFFNIDIEKAKINTKFIAIDINFPFIILLIVVIALILTLIPFSTQSLFPTNGNYAAEKFISQNTGYHDVVFSPNYEIPINPPQKLSYSMKRVYLLNNTEDICNVTKNIKGNYVLNLFINKYNHHSNLLSDNSISNRLIVNSYKKIENDEYVIYKINKTFMNSY